MDRLAGKADGDGGGGKGGGERVRRQQLRMMQQEAEKARGRRVLVVGADGELAEDDEVDGAGGLEMDIRHLDFELSYKGAFNTRFNLHMLSLVNTGPCA